LLLLGSVSLTVGVAGLVAASVKYRPTRAELQNAKAFETWWKQLWLQRPMNHALAVMLIGAILNLLALMTR